MTDIPTVTQKTITAGNSVAWTISLDDYPASDSWALSYILLNSTTKITISSSADGDDHAVDLAAVTTAAYTAGEYEYTAMVTDGTDRYTVETGIITIMPDPSALSTYDGRSHAKKVLDALELLLEGKASDDAASYAIGNRSLTKMSPDELMMWRDRYRAEYRKEQMIAGNVKRKVIKARFSSVAI